METYSRIFSDEPAMLFLVPFSVPKVDKEDITEFVYTCMEADWEILTEEEKCFLKEGYELFEKTPGHRRFVKSVIRDYEESCENEEIYYQDRQRLLRNIQELERRLIN